MEAGKRVWLWGGVVLAGGVGLVTLLSREDEPAKVPRPPLPTDRPATRRRRIPPGTRMLAVGDSLAQGLALPFATLGKAGGVVVRTAGVQGSTVRAWALGAGLARELAAFHPDVVLLVLGTNDLKAVDPALAAEARGLVEQARTVAPEVVWVAPPTMPFPDGPGVRAAIAKAGADVFPSEALSIPRGPDGVHPTAVGYAGWAGALWRWL